MEGVRNSREDWFPGAAGAMGMGGLGLAVVTMPASSRVSLGCRMSYRNSGMMGTEKTTTHTSVTTFAQFNT